MVLELKFHIYARDNNLPLLSLLTYYDENREEMFLLNTF
jgi:hypothetical protein